MRLISNIACLFIIFATLVIIPAIAQNWDNPNDWDYKSFHDNLSIFRNLIKINDGPRECIIAKFDLRNSTHSYVIMRNETKQKLDPELPLVFDMKADAECDLEIKMVDADGVIYWKKLPLKCYKDWTSFVIYFIRIPRSSLRGWS